MPSLGQGHSIPGMKEDDRMYFRFLDKGKIIFLTIVLLTVSVILSAAKNLRTQP